LNPSDTAPVTIAMAGYRQPAARLYQNGPWHGGCTIPDGIQGDAVMGQHLNDDDLTDDSPGEALERSSHPDAEVTLFLRIETASGPRTIISSGMPLSAASAIAEALTEAGHYAHYVDQLPQLSLRDHVARRKYERIVGQPSPLTTRKAS